MCRYFIMLTWTSSDPGDVDLDLDKASINSSLRQNGYKPEDITILVAYSGQFFAMRDEVKRYEEILSGVRICVLDNYQGEECKIILLSLVRNNPEGKIGFLKIENRVCVALSRAKEGLYIMGNIDLLCHNSEIWPKIKEVLVKQNSLGNYLPVRCENHPDQVTKIKEPEDFENVAGGGCSKICGSLLNCGHNCSKTCHILDSDHQNYMCTAKCSKVICVNEHTCQKMCYQDCGFCTVNITRRLECGHEHTFPCNVDPKNIKCKVLVTATLPCGHEVLDKPCSTDGRNFKCSFPCGLRIEPCGHACKSTCHIYSDPEHLNLYRCRKPCEKNALGCTTNEHKCQRMCSEECQLCEVILKKNLPNCNHMQDAKCSEDMGAVQCLKPCKKPLPCGHKCPKKCYEPCGDCLELVVKTADCGHQVKTECREPPSNKFCIGACPKQLKCGHPCKNRCKDPCTKSCMELVEHTNKGVCGHNIKVECHMLAQNLASNDASLLKFCREPCLQILECTHRCLGSCGECFQGRLHVVCSEKCGITLICGHKCKSLCGDVCQPCGLKCSSKCSHTKCKKKCWEPCSKCKAPCSRDCKHRRCIAKCWQKCTVEPCRNPCEKMLKCRHPCVGYCGEPCPQLCRICDQDILTEIFLGYENEENARFVLLDECKHVIESKGLERYFQQGDTENGVLVEGKRCPRCETPLASTLRYKDYIKETKTDAVNLQTKVYGGYFERDGNYKELMQKFNRLERKIVASSKISVRFLGAPVKECHTDLKNHKKSFNFLFSKITEIKLGIFESILEMIWTELNPTDKQELETYLNYLLEFLRNKNAKFSDQVIFDFEREMSRLQIMVEIFDIGKTYPTAALSEIKAFILQPIPYTKASDDQVTAKLVTLSRGLVVMDVEHRAILKDFSFKKRRWFCCPNGHYYMDFGDPAQITKCDQCWE